jgi:hypothetical protein
MKNSKQAPKQAPKQTPMNPFKRSSSKLKFLPDVENTHVPWHLITCRYTGDHPALGMQVAAKLYYSGLTRSCYFNLDPSPSAVIHGVTHHRLCFFLARTSERLDQAAVTAAMKSMGAITNIKFGTHVDTTVNHELAARTFRLMLQLYLTLNFEPDDLQRIVINIFNMAGYTPAQEAMTYTKLAWDALRDMLPGMLSAPEHVPHCSQVSAPGTGMQRVDHYLPRAIKKA